MADLDRSVYDRNPPSTTTISTIAVQSGNTKIVIALLQVSIKKYIRYYSQQKYKYSCIKLFFSATYLTGSYQVIFL